MSGDAAWLSNQQKDEACAHCWDEGSVQVPGHAAKVYKDECMYCFTTNAMGSGLFVCLKCHQGFCEGHVRLHQSKPGNHSLYLRVRMLPPPPEPEEDKEKGKDWREEVLKVQPEPEFDTHLVCFACSEVMVPGIGLSGEAVMGVMNALSPQKQTAINQQAWAFAQPCVHSTGIVQQKYPIEPKPNGACLLCDHTENNWMCLTCGAISCPRVESGGKGHALTHFEQTGHMLVVKIGTITPAGADIHCYSCQDEVQDLELDAHLKFFGIDMRTATKTAKSLAEQEYDANSRHDFGIITEDGKELTKLYGPGYTGINNFGNTCYMASVLQVLFSTDPFAQRFFTQYATSDHHKTCTITDPSSCYDCQWQKIGHGLLSGRFSCPESASNGRQAAGVTPVDFKKLIAGTHADFSTAEQQDAEEYFRYILQAVHRKESTNKAGSDPSTLFDFKVQARTECASCHKARYRTQVQNVLSVRLPIDMRKTMADADAAQQDKTLTPEQVEALRPKVSFDSCLSTVLDPDEVEGIRCSTCGATNTVYSTVTKLLTFPDVIAVQTKRFVYDPVKNSARKVDALVQLDPNAVMDLSALKATHDGLCDGEQPLDDAAEPAAPASGGAAPAAKPVDEMALVQVVSMGIDVAIATWALQNTDNNVERAIDWVFSHPEGPPPAGGASAEAPPTPVDAASTVTDGAPQYELFAMISHIGGSASSGHYVAHVKKEGVWVMYNDEKVLAAEVPPFAMAYMYFLRRKA